MRHHPAEDPVKASWRCGKRTEGFTLADLDVPAEVCTLPAGHEVYHRSDSGHQWRDEDARGQG